MEKINHEFFGELDLNGLDDDLGFSDVGRRGKWNQYNTLV